MKIYILLGLTFHYLETDNVQDQSYIILYIR